MKFYTFYVTGDTGKDRSIIIVNVIDVDARETAGYRVNVSPYRT